MANNNAQRIEIPLNSQINMNKNGAKIYPYNKFNKKNGTIYGECLTPYYVKEEDSPEKSVYDSKGDRYFLKETSPNQYKLFKNDELIYPISSTSFLSKSFSKKKSNKKMLSCKSKYVSGNDFDRYYIYKSRADSFYYLQKNEETPILLSNIDGVCENSLFIGDVACIVIANLVGDNIQFTYIYYNILTNDTSTVQTSIALTNITTQDLKNPMLQLGQFDYYGGAQAKYNVVFSFYPVTGDGLKSIKVVNFYVDNFNNSNCTVNNYSNALAPEYPFANPNTYEMCTEYGFIRDYDYSTRVNLITTKFEPSATKKTVFVFTTSNGTSSNTSVHGTYLKVFHMAGWVLTDYITDSNINFTLLDGYASLCAEVFNSTTNLYQTLFASTLQRVYSNVLLTSDSTPTSPGTTVSNDMTMNVYGNGCYRLIKNGSVIGLTNTNWVMLTEWNDIDSLGHVAYDDKSIFYTNSKDEDIILTQDEIPSVTDIIDDKYIMLDTGFPVNIIDCTRKLNSNYDGVYSSRCALSDFLQTGAECLLTTSDGTLCVTDAEFTDGKMKNSDEWALYGVACAYNPLFEVTDIPFLGTMFAPHYGYLLNDTKFSNLAPYYSSIARYFEVDIFFSPVTENAIPVYQFSKRLTYRTFNSQLEKLPYPIDNDIIYSLSIFAKFVKSYNNHDYVILADKGYPLIYSNLKNVYGYYGLTFIEDIQTVFVVQSLVYMISENKLLSVTYNGINIASSEVVADITGLKFIGALPSMALFYSPYNRKIMSFTGNAIMSEYADANMIDEYYGASYIPVSNSVIFSAREKNIDVVYVIQSNNMVKLENISKVENVYVDYNGNNDLIIVTSNKTHRLRYEPLTGYNKIKLNIETSYFGYTNENKNIVSCWYVRLYSENKESGKIEIQMNTITDETTVTEAKTVEVNKNDWSKDNSILLRFQPRNQENTGAQLRINSDFAVYSIVAETQPSFTVTINKTGFSI